MTPHTRTLMLKHEDLSSDFHIHVTRLTWSPACFSPNTEQITEGGTVGIC